MSDPNTDGFEFPINGALDLHQFSPKEVKQLIPDYIDACLDRNITQLRIIHGKGKGVLKQIVHSILEKHPAVISFRHEAGSGGSWGATVVDLDKGD
jgi:DNA-nicking Smr family endonuclease